LRPVAKSSDNRQQRADLFRIYRDVAVTKPKQKQVNGIRRALIRVLEGQIEIVGCSPLIDRSKVVGYRFESLAMVSCEQGAPLRAGA
jgi:hypothetical protein